MCLSTHMVRIERYAMRGVSLLYFVVTELQALAADCRSVGAL